MDYLGNAELVLLLLIEEHGGINGYNIRRLVEERGLSAWAGVGRSSIYNGLKRIEDRGLARATEDTEKRDRGPRGWLYELTGSGRKALTEAIAEGLSSTREHDARFNIALSGLDQLGRDQAAGCLRNRAEVLAGEHSRLAAVEAQQAQVPFAARLLFDRIRHAIAAERDWTLSAADQIRQSLELEDEATRP